MSEPNEQYKEYSNKLPSEVKARADALVHADIEMVNNIVQSSYVAGMQMAIRVCRNRANDCEVTGQKAAEMEAQNLAGLIRIIQVEIGSGRMQRPPFTKEELDELERIS